jgi:hypothetical protein
MDYQYTQLICLEKNMNDFDIDIQNLYDGYIIQPFHNKIKYEYIEIDTHSKGLEIYENNKKALNFFDICEKNLVLFYEEKIFKITINNENLIVNDVFYLELNERNMEIIDDCYLSKYNKGIEVIKLLAEPFKIVETDDGKMFLSFMSFGISSHANFELVKKLKMI